MRCFHKTSAVEKHISGIMYENPEGGARSPLPLSADAHVCRMYCIQILGWSNL